MKLNPEFPTSGSTGSPINSAPGEPQRWNKTNDYRNNRRAVSMAGEVALSIFGSETMTPSPCLLPLPTGRQARGEGFMKIKGTKERITKDQTHKAISAKPKFQPGAGADRE
jgi:hypothetical protein